MYVLLEGRSALKFDHGLVYSHFPARVEKGLKSVEEDGEQWPDLSQAIVCWMTSGNGSKPTIVDKVDVARDFSESIPGDSICYRGVVKKGVVFPVVFNFWEVVDRRQSAETKVGLQLCNGDWLKFGKVLPPNSCSA